MPDSQLRIAMLSIHSCPVGTLGTKDTGGMSVYILELAEELGKQGHYVDVYTRVHDPNDRVIYALGKNVQLIHLPAGELGEIHKLAIYSYLPDFACNLEECRKQNNFQYDLVFSHYWLSAWVGEYLQEWWHIPHITMFHTLGAVKNALTLGEDEPELRIEIEGELARSCHNIIAPTEKEKEELVHHYGSYPERISVIPCGVNLKRFQPFDKDESRQKLGFGNEKIVLFVGRIESLKGVEQLITAISYLKNYQNPRLVIVGGGDDSQYGIERLQRVSQELDIEDLVIFPGSIIQEKLPYYYSAADVCVIPSYYESFGLVALESLACGTPVIANDVGDIKNIIRRGETGYVLTDNEPHNIAEKIDLLFARSDDGKNTAFSIRESVSEYSWQNIANSIVEELQQAIDTYQASVSRCATCS